MGPPRSTQRYRPKVRDGEEGLIKQMIDLAIKYVRYGHRRIIALLQREGWKVKSQAGGASLAQGRFKGSTKAAQEQTMMAE